MAEVVFVDVLWETKWLEKVVVLSQVLQPDTDYIIDSVKAFNTNEK